MAYTVTHTNGQNPIVIPDGTIDNTTSVILVGKNYPNYGAILDQNFITLLENSASTNKPSSPITGQIWWDTANRALKVNIDGGKADTSWKNVGSTTSGPTQPSNSNVGDLWWDTAHSQLLAYDGTIAAYRLIGPIGTASGIDTQPIYDTDNGQHDVIKFTFGQDPYLILSNSQVFTPNVAINGFSTIKPGLNLASSSFLHNAVFSGQATDAATLTSIAASQFVRNDLSNVAVSGTFNVSNNNGLFVGDADQFNISVTGGNAAITNETTSGFLNFNVNGPRNGVTATRDAMDVYPNGNVIANYDFTVGGNISFANSQNDLVITGTSPSINPQTGALRLTIGGLGVQGNINTGGSNNNFVGQVSAQSLVSNSTITGATIGNSGAVLYGTLNSLSAAQPNITSVGTLTSLSVTGTVTASAGMYGTALTAAQPNITSLGTLTGLTSTGTVTMSGATTVTLCTIANLKIGGGTNGQYMITDGSGNLSWSPLNITGASTGVAYFGAGNALTGTANFTWDGSNLYVNGGINAVGDITAFYTSDARLKTNVELIGDALNKVNSLRGVTFSWNELALGKDATVREVGVIAQEVQAVLPEVVTERETGYLAVKYEKIVPLLIEAIKELKAEVESLKAAR